MNVVPHGFITSRGQRGQPNFCLHGRWVLHTSSSGYLTNEGDAILDSTLVRENEDAFIKVKDRGAFESSDIEQNVVHFDDETPFPDFVAKFEQELDSKPSLAPDVCCFLNYSVDADGSM